MASKPKKVIARATPGRNAPVPHVFRLEDLLAQMRQGEATPARRRGPAPAPAAGDIATARQLAAELEARLRDWRGQAAGSPSKPAAPAPASPSRRAGPARKRPPRATG